MPAPTSYSLVRTGSAVLEDRGLGRRPAHVERDEVALPAPARARWAQAMTPAAGPDSSRLAGRRERGLRAHHAAARLHDPQRRVEARPLEPLHERLEVALDDRPEVRVDHARARPLVLPDLREDLGRARDVGLRGDKGRARSPPRAARARGWRRRAGARWRPASAPQSATVGGDRVRGALVERAPDLAARPHPLRHLEAAAARDERRRLGVLQVVQHRDAQPPHLQHVAEALGRDQRRAGALALQHGVRGDGRGVHDALDLVGPHAGLARGARRCRR